MTKIKNKAVLITGAASGIGKLLAERCIQEGAYKVIIWDIHQTNAQKCLDEWEKKGWGKDIVSYYPVDVSDLNSIQTNAKAVLKEVDRIDILFNNAGIVIGKAFKDHSSADIEKTIGINVTGVMHTTAAFLPSMIEAKEGHIINIASAAGLIPNPNMSVYAASKWAVVGWSESLRLELEKESADLKVTTVEPSYINTGMFDGVKSPLLTPIIEPEFIVEKIIQAVKTNQIIVREPFMVKSVPVLRGILPTRVFDFMAEKMGVYSSMDEFKGRK